MSYIEFVEIERKPKNLVFSVRSISQGTELGRIKWHGAWRQYCLFPEPTIWSSGCLEAVVDFLKEKNKK